MFPTLAVAALLLAPVFACSRDSDSTGGSAGASGAAKPSSPVESAMKPAAPDLTQAPPIDAAAGAELPDPHSLSRPDQVRVVHLGLSWVVDFDAETLTGDAVLLLDRRDASAPLRLDSADLDVKQVYAAELFVGLGVGGVPIAAVESVRSDPSWQPATWRFDEGREGLGRPLIVELPATANAVRITYATRPGATGLQWLEPAQTAGKRRPFLYSQSQAIHARSWIPTQDSPGVRTTWDAEVVVDGPLLAVMAAEMLGEQDGEGDEAGEGGPSTRRFRFSMPQPVPAYLIALAVGDLERRELGPRSAVYADPTRIEAAAAEFVDIEAMLNSAEALYGPYAWGRYDVLVLPPAFPFGGMENPRLTFATPTILAGDRSLVSLIAHELAHSWSGNLVTNRTWGDLWLNEGFTVYFERRIVEAIYGRERAELEAAIGKRELLAELEDPALLGNKPEFQRLAIDLRGRDPDDSFSGVPYEKGALFLRSLEQAYGRDAFDAFLTKWFKTNRFGSVSTADFVAFAERELIAAHPLQPGARKPDLAAWIERPGLPEGAPEPTAEGLDTVADQARRFAAGELPARSISTDGWIVWHWLHFLRSLPEDVAGERLAELDGAFELTASGNAEIVGQWLVIAASRRYEPAYSRMESFLIEVGRRKFLTPIYRALIASEAGRAQAQAIYRKARPGYHAISRRTLDELLAIEDADAGG